MQLLINWLNDFLLVSFYIKYDLIVEIFGTYFPRTFELR